MYDNPDQPQPSLWLMLAVAVVFLLACIGGITSFAFYNSTTLPGTPPSTPTSSSIAEPKKTVQEYYNAIKNKKYSKAYAYFDPGGTLSTDSQSHRVSIDLLSNSDARKGTMRSYTISTIVSRDNTVLITVSVMRKGRISLMMYIFS